jgi:hypothetical protein
MTKILFRSFVMVLVVLTAASCRHKKKTQVTEPVVSAEDTLSGGRCRLDYKSARTLGRRMKEQEFTFEWFGAKADVETFFDEKEEKFDIKVAIRRDSVILVTIQAMLGLQVAKVQITKDSVKFVDYIHKNYFVGEINYINELLNADLDFDLVQAVLVGNSAEFHDDEARLKPFADRQNCRYILSTERKRRLKKIQAGTNELRNAVQTLTLKPDYRIVSNEFIDPATNRKFIANYSGFKEKDSVYAPYNVDIEIVAQKNARVKIEYVRIERNSPQKVTLIIPARYDPVQIQKKN